MHQSNRVLLFLILLALGGFAFVWHNTQSDLSAAPERMWQLTDVTRHLPDLQFDMTNDQDRRMTQADLRGDVVLLFFGFTSCSDECPTTMTRMANMFKQMGSNADHMRLLFVTIDPTVDTPAILHEYIKNFDPDHMIGLTAGGDQVKTLAQRYRAAYQPREAGGKEEDIGHSAALYIFDGSGKARLIAAPTDADAAIEHDLRQLTQSGSVP